MQRLCSWVMREGVLSLGKNRAVIYCVGEADDSGFCPVHRTPPVPQARAPRSRRDIDADILPWDPSDQAIFHAVSSRPKRR